MREKGKIQAVNAAIQKIISHLKKEQERIENNIGFQAVSFSSGARFIFPLIQNVAETEWKDLIAEGSRDLGAALHLVADLIPSCVPMPGSFEPIRIILLFTDGYPSDDYSSGLKKILQKEMFSRRYAIGLGREAPLEMLTYFVGKSDTTVLIANSPIQLETAVEEFFTRVNLSRYQKAEVW